MSTETAPDPVVNEFRLYVESGKIRFTRTIPSYYGGRRGTRRAYTYYVEKRELWRVYVKSSKNWKRIPTYHDPIRYIRIHRLQPIWPKHLQMDKGL